MNKRKRCVVHHVTFGVRDVFATVLGVRASHEGAREGERLLRAPHVYTCGRGRPRLGVYPSLSLSLLPDAN